jgi:hypothetical protein
MNKHPGFKSVAAGISRKEGVSKKAAGAILASAGRKTGLLAKKRNPRLNRISGAAAGGGSSGGAY